ncbi:MAG: O-acetyl-ADP-ribose deacetylase [Acidobacteria bacterium]|nr:O-acetyl-ADP-ribose deacetylase [Acidobacteriota bacterium]
MPHNQFTARLKLNGGKCIEFEGPGDITKQETDAIVNAANSTLLGGGGVDGAIHRAGGPAILAECRKIVSQIGRLPPGKAVLTTAGRLPAKYVLHTVGPVWGGADGQEEKVLASCHRESIRLAEEHGVRSIAFPAISTGAYGYPVGEAARVALRASVEALESAKQVSLVRFVLFDAATLRAFVAEAEKFARGQAAARHQFEKSCP